MGGHRPSSARRQAIASLTGASRAELEARWHELTRKALPAQAAADPDWPIRLDHCFMRVCLDAAIGARWDTVVQRPAIRHLTDEQLARAIHQAERIQAEPASLPALNRQSLRMRGKV